MSTPKRILVVGGNLASLATLLGLLRAGYDATLWEAGAELPDSPDTCLLYASTLEILDRLGVLDRVLQCGEKIHHQQYWNGATKTLAADLSIERISEFTKYPFLLACRRTQLKEVLYDAVQALAPQAIQFSHQLTALTQNEDRVQVDCYASKGVESFDAQLVIGADGADSSVRQLLGIEVDRLYNEHHFWVVEAKTDLNQRYAGIGPHAQLLGEQTLVAVTRFGSYVRLAFQLFPGANAEPPEPAALLRNFLGDDVPFEILRATPLVCRHGVARSYQKGRVVLVGEAAHSFETPLDDLGLNISLHDADHLHKAIGHADSDSYDSSALASYAQKRRSYGLRTMSGLSNEYYDVFGNALLKFGRYETRMDKLVSTQDTAQTFLLKKNLIHA